MENAGRRSGRWETFRTFRTFGRRSILALAPRRTEPDRLVTVILDGENAWEWYRHDMDGKKFLNALYRKLSALHQQKKIITTTTVEYLEGNPGRGVPAHPVESLPKMTWLWPGSWINGNYDTWIGESEENRAWEYLLTTRRDLERTGIPRPDPGSRPPRQGTKEWYAYRAWESMYAAEGSDWFWWFGADQSACLLLTEGQYLDLAYEAHGNLSLDSYWHMVSGKTAALLSACTELGP